MRVGGREGVERERDIGKEGGRDSEGGREAGREGKRDVGGDKTREGGGGGGYPYLPDAQRTGEPGVRVFACMCACVRARARVSQCVCACVCAGAALPRAQRAGGPVVGTIGSDLLWAHVASLPTTTTVPLSLSIKPCSLSSSFSRTDRLAWPLFAYIHLSDVGSTLSRPLARAGFRKPDPAAPLFD